MKIEKVDDQELVARLGQSSSLGVRTENVLHLSDIYKSILTRLQPKRYGSPMDAAARRRMEVGIMFENMLERGLSEKYSVIRPGEIISDEGVYMSPDGINPVLDAGEEYKATRTSSRIRIAGALTPYTDAEGEPLPKFLVYFLQMKGYAKWLGTNRYLLRAMHIDGDYTYPMQAVFLSTLFTFTDDEIEENWDLHIRHAKEEGML